MEYRSIEVPGVGPINFPSTMSDDEITSAIKTKILPAPAPMKQVSMDEYRKQYDRAQFEANPAVRLLRGAEAPAIKLGELASEIPGIENVPGLSTVVRDIASIGKAKKEGMGLQYGRDYETGTLNDTDYMGMAGSVLPSAVIGGGIYNAISPTGPVGRTLTNALGGGAAAFLQPGSTKEDVGLGTLLGGGMTGLFEAGKGVTKWGHNNLTVPGFVKSWYEKNIGSELSQKELSRLLRAEEAIDTTTKGAVHYPATAAEKVSGSPAGTVIQGQQKIIAETPGGVSEAFGKRILDQRAAIQAARGARDEVTGPMRKDALERANFGHEITNLERMIAAKRAGMPPLEAPPAPTVAPGTLKSAVETSAPFAPVQLESALEKSKRLLAGEKRGIDTADIRAMSKMKDIIEQQGFSPLKVNNIVGSINRMMKDPETKNALSDSVLSKVKARLQELANDAGEIDARQLYTLRKQDLGIYINAAQKENANWDKKLTAGMGQSVQKSIDDAIEQAGGDGWKDYLAEYSKRTQAVKDTMAKFLTRYKPEQKTRIAGAKDQGTEQAKHALPNWLNSGVTGTRWLLNRIGAHMEPKIDKYQSDRLLNPKLFADMLDEPKYGSKINQEIVNMLMNRSLAVGSGLGTKD